MGELEWKARTSDTSTGENTDSIPRNIRSGGKPSREEYPTRATHLELRVSFCNQSTAERSLDMSPFDSSSYYVQQ